MPFPELVSHGLGVAAYVQASSDPDKGEVLDATGDEDDPLRLSRRGGVPAHVPYLKAIVYTADSNNAKNHSAKGVWCFEALDRTTCSDVRWRTMPLRIRHVPSGKYLSVDSLRPARNLVKETAGTLYDAALVWDTDPLVEDGAFASASSMIFYLSPTDVSGDLVRVRRHSAGLNSNPNPSAAPLAGKPRKSPQLCTSSTSASTARSTSSRQRSRSSPSRSSTRRRQAHRAATPSRGGASASAPSRLHSMFCGFARSSCLYSLSLSDPFAHAFALHAQIQRLPDYEAAKLYELLSFVRLFKRFSYLYHAAADPMETHQIPLGLCSPVRACALLTRS